MNVPERLTREEVQPVIERLGRICDHGWTFSPFALMALISEIEDLIIAKNNPHTDLLKLNQKQAGSIKLNLIP